MKRREGGRVFGEGQREGSHIEMKWGWRESGEELKRGSENEIVKAARASTGDMYYYRERETSTKKEATRKGREGARR